MRGHLRRFVQRPRPRALAERLINRLLLLSQRRAKQVRELLPQLYLHRLALDDFELAFRGLLSERMPSSSAAPQQLKTEWQDESTIWKR